MVSFVAPFTVRVSHKSALSHCGRRHRTPRYDRRRRPLCVADGTIQVEDTDLKRDIISPRFAEKASGEWFGHEVTFSATGTALNIEDRFVPDAYREWGVEIKGFDTVTSTNVTTSVYQKRTRALPSVGCEADAVVPDTVTYKYENVFAFKDGSFCAGPLRLSDPSLWSFTLTHPQEQQSRARIEFGAFEYGEGEVGLIEEGPRKITVFIERKEAEFCDGQVLPGCGGSGGFAAEEPTDPSELNGTWSISSEAYAANDSWQLLETSRKSSRDQAEELVSTALPRGLSMGICRTATSVNVEVGWLSGDLRVALKRVYGRHGALLSVSRDLETRKE